MRKWFLAAGLIAAGFAGGAQLQAQQGATRTIEAQEIILRSPNGGNRISLRAGDDRCGLYLVASGDRQHRELGLQIDPKGMMSLHFFEPGDKEPRLVVGLNPNGKPWVKGIGSSEDVRELAGATWKLANGTPGNQLAATLERIRDRNGTEAAQGATSPVQRVEFPR